MDIPFECILDFLMWNNPNCSNAILISLINISIWNPAAWGSQNGEDEAAKEVQNLLDQANHGPAPTQVATTQANNDLAPTQAATTQANHHLAPTQAATTQATGCAAAGYTGCCTGDNCKVDSGCYCDVKCYYFHNCCDDITAIGCYRKCAIHFMCSLQKVKLLFQQLRIFSDAI